MKAILFPFLVLSAVGLLASMIVHLAALIGLDLGLGKSVFVLHVGIFVVWLPTVLIANSITKNSTRKDFWKVAMMGCPKWMKYMTNGLFAYCFLNFALFIFQTTRFSKGSVPEIIEARGFSGHWMVFYSAALSVLYSRLKLSEEEINPKCANGHLVSSASKFCDVCGIELKGKAKKTGIIDG